MRLGRGGGAQSISKRNARLLGDGRRSPARGRGGGYRIAVGLKPTQEELDYNRRGTVR